MGRSGDGNSASHGISLVTARNLSKSPTSSVTLSVQRVSAGISTVDVKKGARLFLGSSVEEKHHEGVDKLMLAISELCSLFLGTVFFASIALLVHPLMLVRR